jgi:hypothetical protein
MSPRPWRGLALLPLVAALPALGQDISGYSTTFVRDWKDAAPSQNYLPATEFLGIDGNNLGSEKLSMHLYGWGQRDLADQSYLPGKSAGDLSYGYLQYRFGQANAELKAGRFSINQGIGFQSVDGVSGKTDLRGGFTVSAFAGKPVVYKNLSENRQSEASFQQDVIFGGRLGWRAGLLGEVGVSYLQDGSKPAYQYADSGDPQTQDYTRRLLGADIWVAPAAFLDFRGRTVWDVSDRPQPAPGNDPSRLAEHDYRATAKLSDTVSLGGTYVERHFAAYYAGSTLPSNLFNPAQQGSFKATGLLATWQATGIVQLTADVRRTSRENYGDSTRYGADVRCNWSDRNLQAGAGYHKVNAFTVPALDVITPAYSLSHGEWRAWVLGQRGNLSASLDAILLNFTDAAENPFLYGKSSETALVGSVGYQAKADLKVSGDLSLDDSAVVRQTMGLVRVEYRFGLAGKGGK